MSKTLIADALVLTMDQELGTLPRGDVLIDGSRIRGGGRRSAPRRRRGDRGRPQPYRHARSRGHPPHRHTLAAVLRGCACYGHLGTYFHDVVFTYGANFTPQDTYTSVRFGLAEAIDSGITTMHAWEHNLQTPEHADAALSALEETGLRGRFSYGPSSAPEAGSSFAKGTERSTPRTSCG